MTPKDFKPRQWQEDMLTAFYRWHNTRKAGDSRTFTAAVTGGAGKTFGGAMIISSLLSQSFKNVLVVCPSNVIASQWVHSLNLLDIQAALWESDRDYYIATSFVTTYSMMALYPERFAKMVKAGTILVFDECHHLADSKAWGDAAKLVGKNAGYRLMLTGTPFREDEAQIPFVNYEKGQLVTNFSYSYGQALEDGYVRSVYFRAMNGEASWLFDDDVYSSGFKYVDGKLPETMRAIVSPKGEWLRAVISHAHEQLSAFRKSIPNTAGIITCVDQAHARQVHRLVQQITHSNPVLAISDDADSDAKIEAFRESNEQWLVVVRKGGEGLDIPRLRIGIWATNITKQLSFLQFLWRIVRDEGGKGGEHAYLYMPSHPQLLSYAQTIRELRLHVVAPDALTRPSVFSPGGEFQNRAQSTFAPISSEAGEMQEFLVGDVPVQDPIALLRKIAEAANNAMFNIARDCSIGNKELGHIYAAEQLRLIAAMLPQVAPVPAATVAIAERAEERRSRHEELLFKRQKEAWNRVLGQVRAQSKIMKDCLFFIISEPEKNYTYKDLARMLACGESSVRLGQLVNTGLVKKLSYNNLYTSNFEKHIKENYPNMPNYDFMGDILNIIEGKR